MVSRGAGCEVFGGMIADSEQRLTGVETARHSATLALGKPGVLHGVRTYLLQSPSGQIMETHSISAGLDYPVSNDSGSCHTDKTTYLHCLPRTPTGSRSRARLVEGLWSSRVHCRQRRGSSPWIPSMHPARGYHSRPRVVSRYLGNRTDRQDPAKRRQRRHGESDSVQ
jgi:hypothetical protein